ncbi:Protein disulfide isomerase-like 1-6 [Morus notabilis]|uniref:protein disulfide-isomerase n=1 Tax=Morus notabilis TaxID=981085 RepID=W9R659_9ROSA|nr:protein disulfide isomerase-like 1-6 isoform X2 [Morus notabilis]EXB74511.1 Protein disulfide isomerase-like 1-6 [Morus notabilis]
MSRTKPTSRFIIFSTLTLLLLFTLSSSVLSSEPVNGDDEDSEGIEELLALDEQADQEEEQQEQGVRSSEAELLTKAQRIVVELNGDNTKRVVEGNEFVLVLGYAPWCPRSAELMPQFAQAATSLKELGSPLLMAKLDADRYPKAASLLQIKGFPTLLLFVNGTSLIYSGGFSAEEIVIWARKKTGVPVTRINSVAEAEGVVKKYHTFAIGFFENFKGPDYEEFVKAAIADNEILFIEVNNIEVAKVLFPDIKATKSFFGIVKSEPERYTAFEGTTFEKDKLLQFLEYNKFPLVTKLTEINSVKVYSSPVKLQVIVFAEEDSFQKLLEPLQDVARKFKSKILFIYIDISDENLAKPFLTLYGIEESKDTVVTAFDNHMSSKFLLELDPTPSNIKDFCSRLLDGTPAPYFKSQPIPDNTDATIQVIVGKTFEDLVLNSPKNVLLEVFTPWCINCETTSKQVEKLAKHFRGSDLVFARFDAAMNEHPKLHVVDYPSLLFYKAGDKTNPIKLSTKSSLKDLAGSINKHLKARDKVTKDEL